MELYYLSAFAEKNLQPDRAENRDLARAPGFIVTRCLHATSRDVRGGVHKAKARADPFKNAVVLRGALLVCHSLKCRRSAPSYSGGLVLFIDRRTLFDLCLIRQANVMYARIF